MGVPSGEVSAMGAQQLAQPVARVWSAHGRPCPCDCRVGRSRCALGRSTQMLLADTGSGTPAYCAMFAIFLLTGGSIHGGSTSLLSSRAVSPAAAVGLLVQYPTSALAACTKPGPPPPPRTATCERCANRTSMGTACRVLDAQGVL